MTEQGDLDRRIAEFGTALSAMQQVVAELPTSGQAERAIAMDEKLSRIATMVLVGVTMVGVILALVGWMAWGAKHEAKQSERGVECLIEQFTEHRHAQRNAHQAFARKIDAPYTIEPGELPPPVPHALEAACRPFLEGP